MIESDHVLLVDDDEVDSFLATTLLRRLYPDWSISHARDGAAALEQVAKKTFSLILLDVSMPVMGGLDFLDALKHLLEREGAVAPPVVILTSSLDTKDKLRAAQFPVQGYLNKPLTEEQARYICNFLLEKA